MRQPPRTLAEVVDLAYARTGATSSRQLEAYARKHGHVVTHSTLNNIRSGTYPSRPKAKTLEALAFLSGVSLNSVRNAAGLPPKLGRSLADQLPPDVDELEARPRAALVEMARVLLEMQRRELDESHPQHDFGVSTASARDLGLSGEDVNNGDPTEIRPSGG